VGVVRRVGGGLVTAEDPDVAAVDEVVLPGTFETFFALHRDGLVRLAALLLDRSAGAEDVVHDALAAAWLRWDRLDDPLAYVRRCVVNGCHSERRRGRLLPRLRSVAPRADEPSPDYLLDALAGLPGRQRSALVLRYYLQLTDREIGELLGCRPEAAKSLAHRGLHRLRSSQDHLR
jgi:RNA polymerase sigma factor (sigma-70 family)